MASRGGLRTARPTPALPALTGTSFRRRTRGQEADQEGNDKIMEDKIIGIQGLKNQEHDFVLHDFVFLPCMMTT